MCNKATKPSTKHNNFQLKNKEGVIKTTLLRRKTVHFLYSVSLLGAQLLGIQEY